MATPGSTTGSTSSDADDIALDHPHAGASCEFCAARRSRKPMQHRLWCAIYLQRGCTCGNGKEL